MNTRILSEYSYSLVIVSSTSHSKSNELNTSELADSLGRLEWLKALGQHAVLLTDAQGLTLWVNEAFTQSTGLSLSESLGRKASDLLQVSMADAAGLGVLSQVVHDASGRLVHVYALQSGMSPIPQAQSEWQNGVSLLQEVGLVGFWQRDLTTGQACWDAVCRSIWGLQQDESALTMAQVEQRLSGPDLLTLQRYQADLAAGVAQGDVSYTLNTPTGKRHVRSLWRRQGQTVSGVLIDATAEHVVSTERARLLQTLVLAAPAAQLVFWRQDVASGAVQWLPTDQHPFAVDSQERSQADSILSSVLPEDRPAVVAARDQALRVREVVELEYRVHDRLGRVRHLLTRRLGMPGPQAPEEPKTPKEPKEPKTPNAPPGQASQGDEKPKGGEIIGVLIDVTTQREREMALRRLGAQQALALNALRAGCYRFDLALRQFEFDTAMCKLYGLPDTASQLPFNQWLSLVHPDDRARVEQRAQALFANPGRSAPQRFRIRHASGHMLWIETDRVPEHDAMGQVVALVGTHRDVTGDVQAQAQARALADAQLVARTRAEFLATLAHELRTPLNAVSGFAQLLQSGTPGSDADPMVAVAARHIQTAGDMMVALLDDLGDLASADAGALRWQASRVPVQALLDDCCAWLEQREKVAAQRIHIEALPPGLALWADAIRARQILLNLLSNALKYSEGDIHVHAVDGPDGIRVAVCDAGAGLSSEQLARAFEPFERLGAESGSKSGSGLGLAVCRRLARLMGGDIEVRSALGVGSQFTLLLPAQAAEVE